MPEIVTQARNGYIVKKRDSRQIAEKINFLIANPKKRKILGGRGRVYAKKHLDWKIIVKRYLTVYEKILE
jgi:glycosyltransferase involved in cell wall biosynthesis